MWSPLDEKCLKVSKNTEPKKLAGTIKYYLQEGKVCNLMSLGSQSICICVKAIALLSSMFLIEYQCRISYFHESTETGEISGICFKINN